MLINVTFWIRFCDFNLEIFSIFKCRVDIYFAVISVSQRFW